MTTKSTINACLRNLARQAAALDAVIAESKLPGGFITEIPRVHWQAARLTTLVRELAGDAKQEDNRFLAVTLAALRFYQTARYEVFMKAQPRTAGEMLAEVVDIATEAGTLDPLLDHEIDDLCERLNQFGLGEAQP